MVIFNRSRARSILKARATRFENIGPELAECFPSISGLGVLERQMRGRVTRFDAPIGSSWLALGGRAARLPTRINFVNKTSRSGRAPASWVAMKRLCAALCVRVKGDASALKKR